MTPRSPVAFGVLLMLLYTAGLAVALGVFVDRTPQILAAGFEQREPRDRSARSGESVQVEVVEGMAADEIAAVLVESGVIEDAERFSALLAFTGLSPRLQAGRYDLRPGESAAEVVRRMQLGLTAEIIVAVPEGLRLEEIGAVVVDAGIGTQEAWQEAVAREWPYEFLQGRPPDAGLEGYLMPASYPALRDSTAEDMVKAMLDQFGEQVTPDLIAEAENAGMTLHRVLTLASIVEREAVVPGEQPLIASVFINRLDAGIALQADPTVQYAIATPESVAQFGWWKLELTVDDLDIDSPYNTYLYAGLPPGPIATPGIDAIQAVIRAPQTDYLYFVAAPECDGSHRFAASIDEHVANVEAFRASSCGGE